MTSLVVEALDNYEQAVTKAFSPINQVFDHYSTLVGFPVDQLKYVVCLLACIPLSACFRFLPNPTFKHLYSIVLSIFMCTLCLGPFAWFHPFFSGIVTYLIVACLPHGSVAHRVAFFWAMAYISVSHIYRMYIDYMGWTLDFTGPQMLLTIKLSSFAFSYYDGHRPAEELQHKPEWRARAIQKLPSLLEFYGYVYFLPSFLAGPSGNIKDYLEFTSLKLFPNGKIPSGSGSYALTTMLKVLVTVPGILISPKLPITYLASEPFFNAPLWERFGRVYLHTSLYRCRYYFGWLLAETAHVVSGYGYNGKDEKTGKIKWDRAKNVVPLTFETAENFREASVAWNICTQDWLRNYVYERVDPVDAKRASQLALYSTYMMSAFWHGFYPGYYMFFILVALLTLAAREMRRHVRPMFLDRGKAVKFVYDTLGRIITAFCLNYGAAAFLLLSGHAAFAMWSSLYFVVHLGAVVVLVRYMVFPPRKPRAVPAVAGEVNKDDAKKKH